MGVGTMTKKEFEVWFDRVLNTDGRPHINFMIAFSH